MQYADLLQPPEQSLLRKFRQLGFTAQCLYVRLVSRVGPWFRENKLIYTELGELAPALDILLAQEMAVEAQALSVEELGGIFTRPELHRVFATLLKGAKQQGKPALLEAIEQLTLPPGESLALLAAAGGGRVIAPQGVEQVNLLQLLFFGNRRQSLTQFVLSDLGVARYYPYQLDRSARLFPDRQALDEYLGCAVLADAWYELREAGDVEGLLELAADMCSTRISYPATENRWYRLCNGLARDLERAGEHAVALELYALSRRHPARERSARILERDEEYTGCAALCERILDQPWCEQESESVRRILPRVRRKLDGTRTPRSRDDFPQRKLLMSQGEGPVELQVVAHLRPVWREVHFVENKLMNALFGLAFWEQIFAPVPGAFQNPYQAVPADMYEPVFRQRRERAVAARLEQLRGGDVGRQLQDAYKCYHGYQCQWIDWRLLDSDLLEHVARVVPADHLLAIWERMLFDPRENRAGFPDLIALGDKVGEYRMIEVKAPGDALQDSQRRWLRYFLAQGIPAEVAWVEWQ